MGFDLDGCEPTKECGDWFRNSNWWWRPLWHYVTENCDCLTDEEMYKGEVNSKIMITKAKAVKIGNRLNELIADGSVHTWETERRAELDNMPDVECEACDGKGYRYWKPNPEYEPKGVFDDYPDADEDYLKRIGFSEKGIKGKPVKKLVINMDDPESVRKMVDHIKRSSELIPAKKRDKDAKKHKCRSCNGTLKVRPSECGYPFTEKNVKEFAEFCLYSGGFRIN